MKKIWAKVLSDDRRIKKDMIYSINGAFNAEDIREYLAEICDFMHLPTPLVIENHKKMLNEYSFVRFTQGDFVERIKFFALTLESGD